ncbi:hypothetical protein [Mycobacterium leprae]|uniref:hypothetical protein n=1 Tax=Mycobacterium leprae TaxID=1769 RepID=UPI000B315FC9
MVHRKAASISPEPVGAITNVLWLSAMTSQELACAVVEMSKVLVNHSRVIMLNWPNEFWVRGAGTD